MEQGKIPLSSGHRRFSSCAPDSAAFGRPFSSGESQRRNACVPPACGTGRQACRPRWHPPTGFPSEPRLTFPIGVFPFWPHLSCLSHVWLDCPPNLGVARQSIRSGAHIRRSLELLSWAKAPWTAPAFSALRLSCQGTSHRRRVRWISDFSAHTGQKTAEKPARTDCAPKASGRRS